MDHATSRRGRVLAAVLVVGAGITVASCHRLFSTRVSAIEGNLIQYDGKTVSVYGKVTERYDLPGLRCYVVNDGSGSIGVVTRGPLPRIGDAAHAKGTVHSSFKLGKRSLVALFEPVPVTPTPHKEPPKGPLPR
ncbi:MAG TPA: hypothetical protein VMT19_04495 [Thermoanaerobaculaceae bacterium]|nr:hypothetical protein [Thermoanaerobaculaceae bacterium]